MVIVAAGLGIMNYFEHSDNNALASDDRGQEIYDIGGQKCYKKQNVETYLLMGVDSTGSVKEAAPDANNHCQSDVNTLLVIDRVANTYSTLSINRDAMVTTKILNQEGNPVGESVLQLALVHAMGDGKERSCEMTADSISALLYDQPIDGYVSLNIDSIGEINKLLGGVEVTVNTDLTSEDPALREGAKVRLTDKQAEIFVRHRKGVADGTNENRMSRQKVFIEAASDVFKEKCREDDQFALKAVKELDEYMVTDLTNSQFSKIAKAVLKNKEVKCPEITGKRTISDYSGWAEVNLDQKSIDKAVIELFYTPIDDK
ncbi:MAG: LCP family protein [Firmicutes bacterium]|nr:LCP family protein [Bacillota bacterium]